MIVVFDTVKLHIKLYTFCGKIFYDKSLKWH